MEGSFGWMDPATLGTRELREARTLGERFPEEAEGARHWQELVSLLSPTLLGREMTPARDAMDILGVLQSAFPEVAPSKPRLFISHRRTDVEPARRIAKIAVQCGFTYWLDVEDPVLAALGSAGMPGNRMHAILVAAIIEIALLNSTHVIAVLTRNSFPGPVRGEPAQTGPSLWIPYEFGRAKARCLASNQAASWLSGEVAAQAMPEYLYLGRILTDEEGMEEWLRQQGPMALRSYGGIGPRDPIIAGTKTLDHFA